MSLYVLNTCTQIPQIHDNVYFNVTTNYLKSKECNKNNLFLQWKYVLFRVGN